MNLSDIVPKIWDLAVQRNWGVKKNCEIPQYLFCLSSGNYISIGRNGIAKYKDAYNNQYPLNMPNSIVDKTTYKKLDKQLIEIIRKEIPEAKNVEFRIYSVDDVFSIHERSKKNEHIINPEK